MQFHGRFILNLAQFAALQGGDPKSLVAASTKTYSELSEESCLIDAEAYEAIIQAALRETGDPLFGLHAGAQMNLQAAGLNLQIAQSAATVKEALDYGCKFFQLGCQALPMQLHLEKDLYFLTFHPQPLWKENYSASFQQTLYGFMAFAIRQYHALTQHQFYPRAIQLSAKRPRTWPELERVLGASIQFQRERNALVFRESDLEKKIISQDYELLKILVQHAEAKLEKLPQLPAFKEKVKQGLIQLMQPGFPLQEEMAAHLNMSVRSFQRRLQEENCSFKEILDELRQEFAQSYLQKSELSISEAAYLLGYSDSSSFRRAFKR